MKEQKDFKQKLKELVEKEFGVKSDGMLLVVNAEKEVGVHWLDLSESEMLYLTGAITEDIRRINLENKLGENPYMTISNLLKSFEKLSALADLSNAKKGNESVH